MAWQIESDGMSNHVHKRGYYKEKQGAMLVPTNFSNIKTTMDEKVIAVYQDIRGENHEFAVFGKILADQVIASDMISFGSEADYFVDKHLPKTVCNIKNNHGKLELLCEDNCEVYVNGQIVNGRQALKEGDTMEIAGKTIAVDSFDSLVIQAVNSSLFEKYTAKSQKKDSGLAMAIARVSQNSRIDFAYTKGDLIQILALDMKVYEKDQELVCINQKDFSEMELIGKSEYIKPVCRKSSLRKHPALFICTKNYIDYIQWERRRIAEVLMSQFDVNKRLEDIMVDAMGRRKDKEDSKNARKFPQPREFRVGAEPSDSINSTVVGSNEFSFVALMSHNDMNLLKVKELASGGFGWVKAFMSDNYNKIRISARKYRRPLIYTAAGIVTAAIGLSVLAGVSAGRKGKEAQVSQKLPEAPASTIKVAAEPDIKDDGTKAAVKRIVGELVAQDAETAPSVEPRAAVTEQPVENLYEKASSEIKSAASALAKIDYRTVEENAAGLQDVRKSIERIEDIVREKEFENSAEIKQKLTELGSRVTKMEDYLALKDAARNPEQKNKANSALAKSLFEEDQYDLAWQHLEQLDEQSRAGLGTIYQIYVLEKRTAEAKRTPEGLTDDIVIQAEKIMQTDKYQEIKMALEEISAHSDVDTGTAMPYVVEMPELEKKLNRYPKDSLNYEERLEINNIKKDMLTEFYTGILALAKKELNEKGKGSPSTELLKTLGDLYDMAGKTDKANECYEKSRKAQSGI